MITQTYNLNLVPNDNQVIVNASQYDEGSRRIEFVLYHGRDLFDINDYEQKNNVICHVRVLGTKADNTGYMYDCGFNHSKVFFDIQEQMTVLAGQHTAEIRIVDDEDNIIGSSNFIFQIERAALKDDTVISETDIPLLQRILNNIDSINAVETMLDGGTTGQVLAKKSDADGDVEWKDSGQGGGTAWGEIPGDINDQTDLKNALDSKADDNKVVKLAGNQEIEGTKTFKNEPIFLGSISIDNNASTGKYLQITTNRIYYFWKEAVKDWNTYINFPNLNYADKATLATDIDLEFKEDKSNKVVSLSAQSTDTQYPSAKCVYDLIGDVETLLEAI